MVCVLALAGNPPLSSFFNNVLSSLHFSSLSPQGMRRLESEWRVNWAVRVMGSDISVYLLPCGGAAELPTFSAPAMPWSFMRCWAGLGYSLKEKNNCGLFVITANLPVTLGSTCIPILHTKKLKFRKVRECSQHHRASACCRQMCLTLESLLYL